MAEIRVTEESDVHEERHHGKLRKVLHNVRHAVWVNFEYWGWVDYPTGPMPPDVAEMFGKGGKRRG